MTAVLTHPTLRATLHGVSSRNVWQFRGLNYASISHRFGKPEPSIVALNDRDCTSYGPQCPQLPLDIRHLLRIPEAVTIPEQIQDEFDCLNLDITVPAPSTTSDSTLALPVLIWIHGGSQSVTFGNSASKLGDPTSLVEGSIRQGQSIIVVNVNYRLNIFAFGDGTGEKNLALQDQRAAIEFIRKHIGGFGGDPNKITLAGESAGAVYCHAHMVCDESIHQAILQSGSLYLSPPQPKEVADGLIQKISTALADLGAWSLHNAPVSKLLEVQANLGLVSFYLQTDESLEGWEGNLGCARRLLIGETEYESAIWRNGIEDLSAQFICNAFELSPEKRASASLRSLYGIILDRPVSCKIGALDFLMDARFTLPVENMVKQWNNAQRPVFRYLVDQPNPWQQSSRAHHAVDLLFLFMGFDLSFNSSAQLVAKVMQQKWIEFVSETDPWQPEEYFAFGPYGESKAIGRSEFTVRRRQTHLEELQSAGLPNFDVIVRALAAGRVSLLN